MLDDPYAGGNHTMTSFVRTALEAGTRSWVYRRRLPGEFGKSRIFVTPSAGLKYLLKPMSRVDPPLINCAKTLVRPGNTVWDVGANVGLFAFAAAAYAGRGGAIHCFEADTWLVQLLRRSCAIQPSQNASVNVVPVALAGAVSLRSLAIAKRARASSALSKYGNTDMGGVSDLQTVPAVNHDWLLSELPAPDVLKIDVEGAELEVLRDQTETLENVRPVIICEVSDVNRFGVSEILKKANFRFFDGELPLEKERELNVAPWSTIAIPEEAVSQVL